MLGWTIAGIIAFFVWARVNRLWPFGPKRIYEEFLGKPAPPVPVDEREAVVR